MRPVYAVPLPQFFLELYADFESEYLTISQDDYSRFCEDYNLNRDDSLNIKNYHRTKFLHDCLTGCSASDFTSRGYFNIPYMWHWIEPNRRLEIIHLPDSVQLGKIIPPPEFNRFKSFGHIDREPYLYFSDLVSDYPLYYHPAFGQFRTFGWCSEREMSFAVLFELMGYRTKIFQTGIHVWTEIYLELKDNNGKILRLSAKVDNTFDFIDWETIPAQTTFEQWHNDIGAGSDIRRYNRIIHSAEVKNRLKNLKVSEMAAQDLKKMVNSAIH